MDSHLKHSIEVLKKCFVSPSKLDLSKYKDSLATSVALTIVQKAIENKQITYKQFYGMLKK
jgi:hypothetical protein